VVRKGKSIYDGTLSLFLLECSNGMYRWNVSMENRDGM
jgi:hypothetical protein